MTSTFYILDGRTPVAVDGIEEWAQRGGSVRVDETVIGQARVSTVFLGIDHQHGDGPPLLFETMILGGEHDEYQKRCSTYAQAEAQHEAACALVRGGMN